MHSLWLHRSIMFENLKRIRGWVPIDGTYDLGPGPKMPEAEREIAYEFSRCMTCGCCMEACPQFNESTGFVGAATIALDTIGPMPGTVINRSQA